MTDDKDSIPNDDPYKDLPRSTLIWKINDLEARIKKLTSRTLDDYVRQMVVDEISYSKGDD